MINKKLFRVIIHPSFEILVAGNTTEDVFNKAIGFIKSGDADFEIDRAWENPTCTFKEIKLSKDLNEDERNSLPWGNADDVPVEHYL